MPKAKKTTVYQVIRVRLAGVEAAAAKEHFISTNDIDQEPVSGSALPSPAARKQVVADAALVEAAHEARVAAKEATKAERRFAAALQLSQSQQACYERSMKRKIMPKPINMIMKLSRQEDALNEAT